MSGWSSWDLAFTLGVGCGGLAFFAAWLFVVPIMGRLKRKGS